MKLSKKEIEHIALLARLELSPEELEQYREDLSGVLEYIDQLQEVEVLDVEPTAQVTGLENSLRPDEARPWDEDERRKALELAPEMSGNQYKVKRVLK